MSSVEERLREEGARLGFAQVGITDARPSDHIAFLRSWLAQGCHGGMGYLAREDAVARRADLEKTLKGVRSVVVVADHYPGADPPGVPADPSRAVVARYARGRDYHRVLTERLEELGAWLQAALAEAPGAGPRESGSSGGPGAEGSQRHDPEASRHRVYVDTGPILERELARRAGLGWFGRNTMLIHPERGSYFFLGVLLTTATLDPDPPYEADRCGTCHACLDACPTGALLGRDDNGAPVIDARRCISYLTIEHRGPIPEESREALGNRVFGCDICQEVCPWNARFPSRVGNDPAYDPRLDLDGVGLIELTSRILSMSGKGYLRAFSDSPLGRPRRAGMLRNLTVGLGNSGDPDAVPVLAIALADRSPLVRSHAAWALGRFGTGAAIGALRERLELEEDPAVRLELASALSASASHGT